MKYTFSLITSIWILFYSLPAFSQTLTIDHKTQRFLGTVSDLDRTRFFTVHADANGTDPACPIFVPSSCSGTAKFRIPIAITVFEDAAWAGKNYLDNTDIGGSNSSTGFEPLTNTDIDDKIINKAIEEHTTFQQIAKKYISAFNEDTKKLGIRYTLAVVSEQ